MCVCITFLLCYAMGACDVACPHGAAEAEARVVSEGDSVCLKKKEKRRCYVKNEIRFVSWVEWVDGRGCRWGRVKG